MFAFRICMLIAGAIVAACTAGARAARPLGGGAAVEGTARLPAMPVHSLPAALPPSTTAPPTTPGEDGPSVEARSGDSESAADQGCSAVANAALGIAGQVSLLNLLGLVTKVGIASMWAMCFWIVVVSGVKVSRAWIDRKCMPPKEGDK